MERRARAILWLDACAAATAGLTVLALAGWLAALHGFPLHLVQFIGAANLAYASYSGTLAMRASLARTPSRRAVSALIVANGIWVVVCLVVLATVGPSATVYGLGHIGFEACFVAALALAEYRFVLRR